MSAIFSDYALIEANKRRIIAGDKSQVVSGKSCFQTKTIFLSYKFTMAIIFKKKTQQLFTVLRGFGQG